MTTYYFNSSLISNNSTNTLSMINRQENYRNNLGNIQLAVFQVCTGIDIIQVTNTQIISTFNYNGNTGENFVFEFVV
jgi:hypothetical protein